MLGMNMTSDGWNGAGPSPWPSPQWQRSRRSFGRGNLSQQMDLGAIGSERKVGPKPAQSANPNINRPPSWQDEIGSSRPRNARDAGPLKPYDLDELGAKSPKSRSSSTPAAEAVKPKSFAKSSQLRHLSMSGRENTHEEARRTLRLTKSPTEFVPAAKRDAPRSSGSDMSAHEQDEGSPGQWGFQTFQRGWSPRSAAALGAADPPGEHPPDAQAFIPGFASQPNRDVKLRELRELQMPAPRSGSPDDDPEDLAVLTDQLLSFKSPPNLPPPDPVGIPEDLQGFYDDPEALAAERKRNVELFNTPTPATIEEARQRGIRDYEYTTLQRRDLARRSVPNSTYPFYNGGQEINDSLDDWPADIQRAILQPPPVMKNQFVVVSFKHHRAEVFILPAQMPFVQSLTYGDLVVVQADRGENVGSVWHIADNMMEAERTARDLNTEQLNHLLSFARQYVQQARSLAPLQSSYKLATQPGFIIRKAETRYAQALIQKEHDETKAKRIAATKAQEMGFPLEILDTEFQIDHQKLTIYYISPEYVRFKELVNNIYKIYKMRIWMSSINPQHPPQDFYFG